MGTSPYDIHVVKVRIMPALHIAAASDPSALEQVVVMEKPKRCVNITEALVAPPSYWCPAR